MVHNPKFYTKLAVWGAEMAIGLIFKAAKSIGRNIKESEIGDYLRESTSEFNVSDKQIDSMIYDLKRRDYIKVDEGDSVVLTNKARIKIIEQIVAANDRGSLYRLVSFDIPEIRRSNRNNFRRAIKRMGFKQVQKSLWVTDKNVGNLVEMAAEEYEVSDYVAYFVAEKSNIDKHIMGLLAGNEASGQKMADKSEK